MVVISYGIIRIEKYHREDILGIESHDKRKSELGNSNKDINWSLTHKNYDLHFSDSNITFTKKINERIKELNLSKAPRKDAVVMAQVLITSDYMFFENISQDEQEKFFKDSYDFICKQYGKENIISAIVHLDEATPHMHINFVPVTSDGRLSAKDLFSRKTKALNKLQTDFFEEVAKGYGLERGEEGSQKKHLEVAEYKLKMAEENATRINEKNKKVEQEIKSKVEKANTQLANIQAKAKSEAKQWERKKIELEKEHTETMNRYKNESESAKRKLTDLREKSKALQAENKKVVLEVNKIREIQPTKNIMGFIQNITLEQINLLKDAAETAYFKDITIRQLNYKINSLKEDYEEAAEIIEDASDKLAGYDGFIDEVLRLQKIEKAFLRLPKEQQEILLNQSIPQQKPVQKTVQKTVSKRKGYDR